MASGEEGAEGARLDIYQARGGAERKEDRGGEDRDDVSSRNGRGTTTERFRSGKREPNLGVVGEKPAEMGYYTGRTKERWEEVVAGDNKER